MLNIIKHSRNQSHVYNSQIIYIQHVYNVCIIQSLIFYFIYRGCTLLKYLSEITSIKAVFFSSGHGCLKTHCVNKYAIMLQFCFFRRCIDKKSYFDGRSMNSNFSSNVAVASGNSHRNILLEKFGMSGNTQHSQPKLHFVQCDLFTNYVYNFCQNISIFIFTIIPMDF